MKEDFLQYIWANFLYKSSELTTHTGKKVRILHPGEVNRNAGPDFFNARVQMDGFVLAGNVEIHLKSSDWYRHGHHLNAAYDNVILSVVRTDDAKVYNSQGREVECVVPEFADDLYREYVFLRDSRPKPECARRFKGVTKDWFYLILPSLAVERLERKVEDIRQLLLQTGNDWEECFYRLLCKYWAGNVNSEAFYQLALHLPYKVLLKYAGQLSVIEALIFGVSGLLEQAGEDEYVKMLKKEYVYYRAKHWLVEMPAQTWRFMRVRPGSFPTVRLALLAAFICRFREILPHLADTDSVEKATAFFDIGTSPYWDTHYRFQKESAACKKRMGKTLRQVLLINAFVPFLFIYGRIQGNERLTEKAVRWLEQTEPENNHIIQAWEKYGFVFDSALQTQALIQLKKEYCDKHLCLKCRVGREVLKSKSGRGLSLE
ncbi:MAG: DUF2851 family protein [Oscillibacter sp.]|nr:DUF2851 family protein [Oscillibacter sp.]